MDATPTGERALGGKATTKSCVCNRRSRHVQQICSKNSPSNCSADPITTAGEHLRRNGRYSRSPPTIVLIRTPSSGRHLYRSSADGKLCNMNKAILYRHYRNECRSKWEGRSSSGTVSWKSAGWRCGSDRAKEGPMI